MDYEYYKAASERTDADERALIPGFKQTTKLPQGTPVMCNGYRGTIVRHYSGNMYEIRMGSAGVICTADFIVQHEALDEAHEAKESPADPDALEALDQLEQANEGDQ